MNWRSSSKSSSVSPGCPDDEGAPKHEIRDRVAQPLDDFVHPVAAVTAPHGPQHVVGSVLKRHVDVGEDFLVLGEDLDQPVGQLLGVEVVGPHPTNPVHVA